MSMFSNYENLDSSYQPNNRNKAMPEVRVGFDDGLPHKAYNLCGEFIGYSWNYGDTLILDVNINPVVKVEADAIIYTEPGEEPTSETVGRLWQRAYNTADFRCWICETLDQTVYAWEELKEFSFPESGDKEVTLKLYDSFDGISGKFKIYNFRWEEVASFDVQAADTISIEIDSELSAKLIKGVYYCSIEIGNENTERVFYKAPLIIN